MKDALRAAGVPTAASAAVTSAAEVHAFADSVGFPIVLKPRTGAGALDTTRVDDPAQLEQALGRFGGQGVESIAVEEFVEGHEGFYDTLTIDGTRRPRLRLALLPERARGDAHAVDLPAVRLHEPGRLGPRLPGAARPGRAGQRSARHRHHRHAHGVVLRAEGPAVLRDRLPPARGRGMGPLLGGQRRRRLPRVGERRGARPRRRPPVAAASPPGSSPCGRTATGTSPATPGSTRPRPASASG